MITLHDITEPVLRNLTATFLVTLGIGLANGYQMRMKVAPNGTRILQWMPWEGAHWQRYSVYLDWLSTGERLRYTAQAQRLIEQGGLVIHYEAPNQ